jgi:hypothetical protein
MAIFNPDETLAQLQEQLENLTAQRDDIERMISATKQSIHGVLTMKNQMFGGRPVTPVATTSLTDACRHLMKAVGVPLTPSKVKEGLEMGGYDFSGYRSNPIASIHTVLKRLAEKKEVSPLTDGGQRVVAYQWIYKDRKSIRSPWAV